jgi:hypothetical protein
MVNWAVQGIAHLMPNSEASKCASNSRCFFFLILSLQYKRNTEGFAFANATYDQSGTQAPTPAAANTGTRGGGVQRRSDPARKGSVYDGFGPEEDEC